MSSVLVTGASRGIGLATCVALARARHRVFGAIRDPQRAPELGQVAAAEDLPITVVTMDVDSDDSVRECVGAIIEERLSDEQWVDWAAADDETWYAAVANDFGLDARA